jgi:hypothetical protein
MTCYFIIVQISFLIKVQTKKPNEANKEHASVHFHNSDVNLMHTEVFLMDDEQTLR